MPNMNVSEYLPGNNKQAATLTETLEQTEKRIYSLAELVDAIGYKLNGPSPVAAGCGRPECQGVCDQATHNLAMLNDLEAQLSHIADRL